MFFALTGAVAAAVCYGIATVLEAVAVSRLSGLPAEATIASKVRSGYLYGIGLLIDGLGFVLSAAALHLLPLFLVESIVASSVAVTAVLAVIFLGQKLRRAETAALGVLVIGLIGLGLTAKDGPAVHASGTVSWAILATTIPLAGLAAGLVVKRGGERARRASGIALAAIAGLGFGMVGVAARLIPDHAAWTGYLADPLVWAVVGYGALAVVVYGFALDRLPTTTAASLCFSVETVFPSAVGLLLLGDEIRNGLWPLAAAGLVLTLGACIALSARSEVEV
nr:hypothetical protein [Corynebacterium lactis]